MKYDSKTVRKFSEFLAAANNLPVPLVDKDIWITYMLREIYSLPDGRHLVFKGGTCLVKAYYGYYRFSEDIDLTWTGGKIKERDFRGKVIGKVIEELGLKWYEDEKVKGVAGSHSGDVMNYFLRSPEPNGEASKLKITVAFKEKLEFPVQEIRLIGIKPSKERKELEALYGNVAIDYFNTQTVPCYSIQEIACEKIRALLTRKPQLVRSRDIVDLHKISVHQGGLQKAAPASSVKAKLSTALKKPSYATEYARATEDIYEHLQQLAEQSAQDPVFIEKQESVELYKFVKELGAYLVDNKIAETRGLRKGLPKALRSGVG